MLSKEKKKEKNFC